CVWITKGIPSSSIPRSTSFQTAIPSSMVEITIAGVLALLSMRELLMPGENQPGRDRISRAFCAANVSATGHQAIVRQRIGDELRDLEIQRRSANQHDKRNVTNVAGRADLAQRAQGVSDENPLFGAAANGAYFFQR